VTNAAVIPPVSAPLPWQGEVWTRLAHQLESGQLPHALLLCGPEHTGKARLAMTLSRLLLCASPSAGLNCGVCHACELSASGGHGDFRWLEPEEKSRVIKVDQVRGVVELTNRTAGLGQRKVVVFAPAESMNINAANALLKVLEEPAANPYLLLVCHRPQRLPATIRSRCQIIRLSLPRRDQSLPWLDGITGSRAQSERLLEIAGGQPLLAERLHGDSSADRLERVNLALREILHGGVDVGALATALADIDSLEQVLVQLEDSLRSLLRNLSGPALKTGQARCSFELMDEIRQIRRAVEAGSNPNRQLLVDAMLGKVQRVLGRGEPW